MVNLSITRSRTLATMSENPTFAIIVGSEMNYYTPYDVGCVLIERRGKELHEEKLKEYISNCKNKIVDLAGKSPDAIEAVIENGKVKLIAVEILPSRFNKNKNSWQKTFTYKDKEYSYRMFDEVKIITYRADYTKPIIVDQK